MNAGRPSPVTSQAEPAVMRSVLALAELFDRTRSSADVDTVATLTMGFEPAYPGGTLNVTVTLRDSPGASVSSAHGNAETHAPCA